MSQSEDLMITAKRAGFRRAGIAHPATPTLHHASAFSASELAALRAEPMLVVVDVEPSAPVVTIPRKKDELQAWLAQAGVAYDDADTVAQLTEKAKAHLADATGTEDGA